MKKVKFARLHLAHLAEVERDRACARRLREAPFRCCPVTGGASKQTRWTNALDWAVALGLAGYVAFVAWAVSR